MALQCKKCESNNVIEKKDVPIHNIGVYCGDCDAWITWGSIKNSELMPEGIHIVTIIKAEEINSAFIFLKMENKDGLTVKYQIWKNKNTQKYDASKINCILHIFKRSISNFHSLNELLTFLQNKTLKIEVIHSQTKNKIQAQINKWIY